MLKKFFSDGLIYTIGNILSRSLVLILLPLYTRELSPTDYGIMDLCAIFGNLITLTIALEITQSLCLYYIETKEIKDKIEYASTALIFTFIIYSIFLLIGFYFSEQLTYLLLNDKKYTEIFLLSTISIYFNGFMYFFQNIMRSDLQARNFAMTSVLYSLSSLSFSVYFILFLKLGIYGSFYGIILGNLFASIIGFYFTNKSFHLIFNMPKLKKMLKFSIPLVPSSIGVFVFLYVDRFAIKELMGTAEVGIYGIAYKFASIIGILLGGFQTSVTPLIYESYENTDTPKQISNMFNFFCMAGFLLMLFLSIFSLEIITIFTTKDYIEAYKIIPLLSLSIIGALIYVFAPGLIIKKNTTDIALINIFGGLLNVLLNFILIPTFKIPGSALATLISSMSIFFLYVIKGQKLYYIPYSWNKILAGMIIISLVYFFCLEINTINLYTIGIKILISILSIISILFIFLDKENYKTVKLFIRKKLKLKEL